MHSRQEHLYALLKMATQQGVDRVFVHAFTDGRDTLPTNGAGYLEQLQQKMREYNSGKIATVSGRYYAMDRDRRWERIAKAYSAMVEAKAEGGIYSDAVHGMKESYNKDVTDEFVVPFVCTDTDSDKNGRCLLYTSSGRFNGGSARGRECLRSPALPLSGRRCGKHVAVADDEYSQRRSPRR